MTPLPIHNHHNPHRRIPKLLLHLFPIPHSLGLTPRRRQRHIQNPVLPDRLFVCFGDEPSFSAFPFEELEYELAFGGLGLVLGRLLRAD